MTRLKLPSLVLLLATVLSTACGKGTAPIAPTPPPPVELTSLDVTLEEGGCGSVSYGLRHVEGKRADVVVELDAEGDGTFTRATQAGSDTHSGLVALATSPEGTPHAFYWNRSEDRPGAAPSARLRVTATVPGSAPATRTVPVPLQAMTRRCEWSYAGIRGLQLVGSKGVVLGDFDRDGKQDFVDLRYSVLRTAFGRGNGTFRRTWSNAMKGAVWSMNRAATDLDGDGALDLVFLNYQDATYPGPTLQVWLTVARGRGDGTFEPSVTTVMPQDVPQNTAIYASDALVTRDLDGDGAPEVVVAPDGVLYVLRYTDGALSVAFTAPVASSDSHVNGSIVAGDFDEDGREDVLRVDKSLQLFRGQGQLGFTPELLEPLGGFVISAEAADFNGDGHLDLAAMLLEEPYPYTQAVLNLYPGDGTGRFGAPVQLAAGPRYVYPLFAADLDENGTQDLAYMEPRTNAVTLLLGRGDGTFERRSRPSLPVPIIGAADFDGSGRLDLMVNWDGVYVVRDPTEPWRHDVGSAPVFGDFNADGWEDVASLSGQDTVQVHFTRAEGGLRAGEPSPVPPGTRRLLTGHFDPGSTLDLLAVANLDAPTSTGSVSLLRGNGDGTFAASEKLPVDFKAMSVVAGDVDADGDLDVVCATWPHVSRKALRLLHNTGDGTFGPGVLLEPPVPVNNLAMADLNQDGRADLVALTRGLPPQYSPYSPNFYLTRYEAQADGTLTFAEERRNDEVCDATELVLKDTTDDGYLDVSVSCAEWDIRYDWGDPYLYTVVNFGAPTP